MMLRLHALLSLALLAVLAAGCGSEAKRYPLRGEVVRLDPQARTATIKHEKIGDWMDAMTMEFPVKDAQEFVKLAAGDKITATVFVRDSEYWIAEIRKVEP